MARLSVWFVEAAVGAGRDICVKKFRLTRRFPFRFLIAGEGDIAERSKSDAPNVRQASGFWELVGDTYDSRYENKR